MKKLTERIDDLKQRIAAWGKRIWQYTEKSTRFNKNRLFQSDQKRLYKSLDQPMVSGTGPVPNQADTVAFWRSLWSEPVNHNEGPWKVVVASQCAGITPMHPVIITPDDVAEVVCRAPNWKSPGLDGLHHYWLKGFMKPAMFWCITQNESLFIKKEVSVISGLVFVEILQVGDQELLSNDVEISGVTELGGENLMSTVTVLSTKLGITLDKRDIVKELELEHMRSTLEETIVETRSTPLDNRPRLPRIALSKRNRAVVRALNPMLVTYLEASRYLCETDSILFGAALATCRIIGAKVSTAGRATGHSSAIPAWRRRIEERIAKARALIGRLICFRSGNNRPRIVRTVRMAFAGTNVSLSDGAHR
ncbi:unnamed protein product [Parnassius apollo]|uniref:(apollo) hypothetical protein n=1 Tax=Parnassius apollo TaxID=110799 RepID=A0A8S3XDZ9_PARAO|nr:unnamed protein product [Parnassius apollo]